MDKISLTRKTTAGIPGFPINSPPVLLVHVDIDKLMRLHPIAPDALWQLENIFVLFIEKSGRISERLTDTLVFITTVGWK